MAGGAIVREDLGAGLDQALVTHRSRKAGNESADLRDLLGLESALIARNTIWLALDRLTPRRRAVLIMYELEGLTIPAIASLLGITVITTRWHLSKGRLDLARVLKGQMEDFR